MNDELIMTEDEAKEALFRINYEYMSHTPVERIKLYDEYKVAREKVRNALAKYIETKREQSN